MTTHTFESAFKRLEEILDKMGKEQLPLEESLTLFEEASALSSFCSKTLEKAEQKVEILIKERDNLALSQEGAPLKEPFTLENGKF